MTETPNKKKFMREKIVKPPVDKRRIVGRFLCLFFLAVILGVVAAVSFVVSRPMAEKIFGSKPPETSIPITIERDSDPANPTTPRETMAETGDEGIQMEDVREELESMVDQAMDDFSWSEKGVQNFNAVLQKIGQQADKAVVTISSVKRQVDWFDNPVESTGQYAGIIIAINPSEVIILARENAVEEADALRVMFGDGSVVAGEVKQRDATAGIAIVRVPAADISEDTIDWIAAVPLGNSYMVKTGDMIVAVGSPVGHVHSIKYGVLSYIAKGVQIADGQTRVLYVDFDCETEAGTFLLNLSGELIGWATDHYDIEEVPGVTLVASISEYKGALQKLTNGIAVPYLGIRAQEVSEAMQEEGVPKGIYIMESIVDGPAYGAGIQNGDILTKIQERQVTTIREFQGCLEDLKAGDQVDVTIQRKGIDEYKEIAYHLTIGAR